MIKVLVIDDQESIKIGLTLLLKKKGFYAKSAGSAEEALVLIEKEFFNYIVSDLRMPGLSGIELARELKNKNSQIKIILISAYFSLEDAIEALRLKVCDMFAKPIDNNLIINRIQELATVDKIAGEEPIITTKEHSKFKLIRSCTDNLLFTSYYNNNIKSFKFISHRLDSIKIRYCVISNGSDEITGFLKGFFDLFNCLNSDFSQIESFFKKVISFNYIKSTGIGVLFGETNNTLNKMEIFVTGNIGATIALINDDDVALSKMEDTLQSFDAVKDFFILVYNNFNNKKSELITKNTSKDMFSLRKESFLFNDLQILNLINDFPFIDPNSSFMLLQPFDSSQKREFYFDVSIEDLNLECLFEFIKIHLEYYLSQESLKVIILSSIAEIISRLYYNHYNKPFQIILSVSPKKMITIKIKGDNFSSYIDLTKDIILDNLISFSDNFSFIGFDDIKVSDNIIEIGVLLK